MILLCFLFVIVILLLDHHFNISVMLHILFILFWVFYNQDLLSTFTIKAHSLF